MRQYPKTITLILSILYLLYINQILLNLYFGAASSDIHNYIFNINKTLEQGSVLDNKWFFYTVIRNINLWLGPFNSYEIFFFILSVNVFLLSHKLFQSIFYVKKKLLSFILVLLILLTPSVFELIAANIRSGTAFVIFLYGIKSKSRLIKLIFISLSIMTHFWILLLLSLYILFFILKKTNITRGSTFLSILFLIFFGLITNLLIKNIIFTGAYQYSFLYSILLYFITAVFIHYNKKILQNEDGFVSIGLMLFLLMSFFFDINIIRYLPVAFILFGISVINNHNINILKNYTFVYFFLVIIFQFYFFLNLIFYGYI